jgi:hypothetical protein
MEVLHLPGNKEKVAETHSEKDSCICKDTIYLEYNFHKYLPVTAKK